MSMPCNTIAKSKTKGLACDEASDAEQLQARVGAPVGHTHRISRYLASGGMGHVFLAEHVHLGVYAAVKVARYGHDAARQTIAHEACMLSQLEHPNIVRVLDVGQLTDGSPYLMMEYVSGLELDNWLDGCGTMPAKRALGVLKQLACAVDYLHAQGIVHGDIEKKKNNKRKTKKQEENKDKK
jgi:serine/threonine protein kinase